MGAVNNGVNNLRMFPHSAVFYRFGNERRDTDGSITRESEIFVIEGVLFNGMRRGAHIKKSLSAVGVQSPDNKTTLYIPFSVCADTGYTPKEGDFVTKGAEIVSEEYNTLAKNADLYKISAVVAYDCGGLPHYEVTIQ